MSLASVVLAALVLQTPATPTAVVATSSRRAAATDDVTTTFTGWRAADIATGVGDTVSGDTAWLTVPERHGRDGGAVIRLPVVRLRSTAARPGPPIVYLAGGPGKAGIPTRFREMAPHLLALRAFGDVILYDQRGTGRAFPSLEIPGRFDMPMIAPVTSDTAMAHVRAMAREGAAALRARGIDLAAYNTVESAEDLEVLRQALGAPQVVLWGHSYGSHLALAYLGRHEAHVARVILGGVNALDQRWRLPGDGDRWLARIDSMTKADPRLRADVPDFLGTTRRVLAALDSEPAVVVVERDTMLIGGDEVAILVATQGGSLMMVQQLPQMMAALDAGRYGGVAAMVRDGLRRRPVATAMAYTMHLASGVSAERRARIDAQARTATLGNAINWPFTDPAFAAAWGAEDLGDAFRAPVRSNVPALLMSGTLDGRTSLDDAAEVRRGLPNATQVIVDGASHNFYDAHPRVLDLMVAFVRGDAMRDTTIVVPLELRSPAEPRQVTELRELARDRGAAAAVARLQAMAGDGRMYVSSFVPGIVGMQLRDGHGRPREAIAVWEAGTALFPRSVFLFDRLGETYERLGDRERAVAAYRGAQRANPLDLTSQARLRALGAWER